MFYAIWWRSNCLDFDKFVAQLAYISLFLQLFLYMISSRQHQSKGRPSKENSRTVTRKSSVEYVQPDWIANQRKIGGYAQTLGVTMQTMCAAHGPASIAKLHDRVEMM